MDIITNQQGGPCIRVENGKLNLDVFDSYFDFNFATFESTCLLFLGQELVIDKSSFNDNLKEVDTD